MKVIAFNGSTRGSKGNTHAALELVGKVLKEHSIEFKLIDLSEKNLNPCRACFACKGKLKCIQDDDMNELFQEMLSSDGIILGSPTYFSNVTSRMQMLVERCGIMARTNNNALRGKVGASVAVARRAGANVIYSVLNYFFGIAEMPIASSSYWNVILAKEPGDLEKDQEGKEILSTLGKNMARLLKSKQ
ncbi:MAG: flavodoxin family protein [Promethearchaeota archaeon]